jgi:ABC-2 type transport system permease protein
LILVVALSLWGLLERGSSRASAFFQLMSFLRPGMVTDPRHYRVDFWRLCYGYFLQTELRMSMILILLVGPSLISQDLRFNALPLYFSRPLRRIDYFLGKLGVIVTFLGLVVIVPSVVAYILGLLFSLDITIIGDTFEILLASVAYGLVVAFSAGMLVLALSAMSRNSRYVALFWVAFWLVSGLVGSVLQTVDSEQRRHVYYNKIVESPPGAWQNQTPQQRRALRDARQKARTEYRLGELEFSRHDWRPLVSYTADLSRLGEYLLRTNETWQRLSLLEPDFEARDRLLASYMGPQFPWYWSAGVLAALFGISACMLNLSVKSLDRLK